MADIFRSGAPAKPGPWRRFQLWWGDNAYTQIFLIAGFFVILAVLGNNVLNSMHRLGVSPGLEFLQQPASFDITEALISFASGDTFGRAILVGLLNTLKLAFLGCIFATILGVSLGIARLSGNLLLSRLVQGYVEVIRNTPLTLQLFFWIATTRALPDIRQAFELLPGVYLSGRGIFLPWLEIGNGQSLWLLFAILILLAIATRIVLRRLQRPLALPGLLVLLAIFPAIAAIWIWFAGVTFAPDVPVLGKFNINGGVTWTPEFATILTGLTIYYAASISESVRSGIQSVGIGQWEAGRAIGLPSGRIMRLIVMPQAMRVITPLMTSSYLDLTKDTTLGLLIGFAEVTGIIKTSINNTGNAVEAILVLLVVFLTVSLPVSFMINLYNRRLAARGIIAK